MEREKGFESGPGPVISRTYDTAEGDTRGSTRPPELSECIENGTDARDVCGSSSSACLPSPTPDLFIAAGAIVAGRAATTGALRTTVDGLLRRALDQAAALTTPVA